MEERIESFMRDVSEEKPSSKAIERWRTLRCLIKNPKRRFTFAQDHLSKSYEAATARRRTNQEKFNIAVLVSKASFQFINGFQSIGYTVPIEVQGAGFQICADELEYIVDARGLRRLKFHGGVSRVAEKLGVNTSNGLDGDVESLKQRQKIYGTNQFIKTEASGFWVSVIKSFRAMTFTIFGVSAVISLIVGMVIEGWLRGTHDGL